MENLITTLRQLEDSGTFDSQDSVFLDLNEESLEWILLNYIPKQENLKTGKFHSL